MSGLTWPAAVGTLTGLVCVMAVNPSVAGLQLPLTALLAMALGVLLSTAVLWVRRRAATDDALR